MLGLYSVVVGTRVLVRAVTNKRDADARKLNIVEKNTTFFNITLCIGGELLRVRPEILRAHRRRRVVAYVMAMGFAVPAPTTRVPLDGRAALRIHAFGFTRIETFLPGRDWELGHIFSRG